jgi:hypothetical protein
MLRDGDFEFMVVIGWVIDFRNEVSILHEKRPLTCLIHGRPKRVSYGASSTTSEVIETISIGTCSAIPLNSSNVPSAFCTRANRPQSIGCPDFIAKSLSMPTIDDTVSQLPPTWIPFGSSISICRTSLLAGKAMNVRLSWVGDTLCTALACLCRRLPNIPSSVPLMLG